MIQFDRIRKSSVLRDKVYYLCNHIKFYSIKDPLVTAFYFLTQSLALISTFIASPLAQDTSTASVLQTVNSIFFFYTNQLYLDFDASLVPSHLISLALFLLFGVVGYFTYSLDHTNHIMISKGDRKKMKIVEIIVFVMVTFSIPLGSFMWYYVIRLFQQNMEYLAVISLFNLVCIFCMVYVIEECSIESDLKNYKSLSRLYSKNQSIHSIVKMMVRMIIASFNNLTDSVIIFSLLALLAFDLYELRLCLISKKFLNSSTESLYYYKNVATVILQLMMLFCLITSFPLIINNFFLSVLSTSLLAFVSLAQFKQNKKINLILDGLDAVFSEDDAKIYMLEMISMLDTSKNGEEIFTLSLITIHKEKCRLDNCFCRSFNDEGYNKLMGKGEFLKRFILSKLEGAVDKFSSSYLILSIFLNYKLSIMSSFSKIYYLLKVYTQKNEQALQSFSQQFMLYQVEIIIQKEIYKNNSNNFVEVEKTFQEDELKIRLTKLIYEVNSAFTEKYKLLGQEICNLNIVDELCLKISNTLRAIEAIWKEFERQDSYNLKIYQIFLIYFEYIIFSKKQASLIKTTIIRKTQSLQHLKGISEDNIERYIYTDKACVIQTIFNKEKVGIVTNITSSCQKVFKLTRDQIMDKDLHDLMPEYFANEHRKWTQDWLDNEVLTGKILGLVKTYFVDNAGNTFSCSLHMKIASVGFKLKFYLMLIKDNSSDYVLLNHALEIQGIGSRLEGEQVFEMSSLKKSITEYTEADIKRIVEEVTEGEPVKKRLVFRNESNLNQTQKLMGFAILGACSEVCLKQPPEAYIYECEILFERHSINKFNYFTLKFHEIRKLIKHNSGFYFKTIAGSKDFDPSLPKKNSKSELFEALSGRQNHMESDNMLKQSESDMQSNEENKFEVNNMSSVAESSMTEGNLIFSKLAEQIKEKSVNSRKITDKRLSFTTVVILIMIGVVAGSAFLQTQLFSTGMKSYSQIIFATSAVSKNNQLLEAIFGYATSFEHYCLNSSQPANCTHQLLKSRGLSRKVFKYLIDDIKVYLINKTSLTGIRYYSYYDDHVDLYFSTHRSSVTVKEFIEYYFYTIQTIQNTIQLNPKKSINESMQFLINNWQTMKNINDQALSYYQACSNTQFKFLTLFTYLLYALFLVTLFLFLFLVNRFYNYIETKKENIIRLHGFLTHATCSKLRQIGDGVRECLAKSYIELETSLQVEGLREGKQKSQYRYQKSKKFNSFLALFFIIMTVFNSAILYQVTIIFTPASEMMSQLTFLVQSENIALESYLQTKAIFLFGFSQPNKVESMNEAMRMIATTESQFSIASRSIQKTISVVGGQFADNFNNLLIGDVCNLTAKMMPIPILLAQCQSDMNYGMLDLGAVTAVNFIVRNVMSAMMKLMRKTADNTIFYSPAFEDVDNYIYYLFNIYQLLESQVISGMDIITETISSNISIIIFFEISILASVLFVWIARINKEKENLSNLYAQVFQLPQVIFRENKIVLKILEENLTLKL